MTRRAAMIVRGTTVLPLDIVGSGSVRTVLTDKGSKFKVVPQQYDLTGQGGSGELYEESWTVMLRECSQDQLAVDVHNLLEMLREAWRYTFSSRQIEPTYLKVRVAGESKYRYALVHSSPYVSGAGPDFNSMVEARDAATMEGVGVPILRYCWQDGPPGVLPSLETLTKTDQPADDTTIYVANHRDTAVLTHIYNYDALPAWSGNLVASTSIPIWSVAAAMPAVGDIIYFGNDEATDRPFHHVAIPITTIGNYNCDVEMEYYNGAWVALPNDTKMTILPGCVINGAGSTIFKVATTWLINVGHLTDWTAVAVNGVTGYWIRARLHAVTAFAVAPVTSATVVIYVPKTPEVRIPVTAFPNGDTFPVIRMLMHHPAGGDDDEGFPNTSRIIVGLKSRNLTNFVSHLNWANAGNPGAWTSATAHADATQVADPACPMGQAVNVSFATDASLTARWTLTGDDVLDDWAGTYRVFLRCRQVAGAVGEVSVALTVRLLALSNYNPGLRMPTKALATFDSGLEVVDFGVLTLPFLPLAQADVTLLGADLIFQVLASRNAAAATLRIADLILIPIDEWSAQYDDPLTDTQYGSSALRGYSALDVDGGVIRPRVQKWYSHLGTMVPTETWRNGGAWPKIPPATAARLYFLMCHFRAGGTWGTGPYIATLGQMLAFQLYGRERYLVLRGNR
ncbi:MAG: hypothetical protein MUP86_03260 [Dehalococcoidia bacterium]|nr:hypothetical protein [Dehalococcoidia bacterium]